MINTSHFYDLLEPMGNRWRWSTCGFIFRRFVPIPACTALPPNANFGLSDWNYWSSGLIYVSGFIQPCVLQALTLHADEKRYVDPVTFTFQPYKFSICSTFHGQRCHHV